MNDYERGLFLRYRGLFRWGLSYMPNRAEIRALIFLDQWERPFSSTIPCEILEEITKESDAGFMAVR